MQIKNIGIDIVEISRIQKIDIKKFSQRILSPKEREIFSHISNDQRKISFIAGRWAVKEAIFKANFNNIHKKNFNEYTILNNESGAPFVENFDKDNKIMISISHSENYALAFAILLQKNII